MARYRNSSWRGFDPDAPRAAEATTASVALRCRVLGLDPGSLRTGYGIIDCDGPVQRFVDAGCIRTQGASAAARLRCIYEAVAALVETHRPDEVAIERVFVHRNPDSALKLGQARGVALCAAALHGAMVFEYAPRAIKLALVGHGNAEKLQVAHMVKAILAIELTLGLDASDALAVGLCHGQSRRLNALTAAAVARA
ncbi:MAG: crossover junction endodeoxyribonuclease RuvC [Pseudomonadota bacterium]